MSVIRYTAIDRGKLISGHSEATEYSFEVPISSFGENTQSLGSVQTSLSGNRFQTLHSIERAASLSSSMLHRTNDSATIESMEEFLSSVAAGEPFEIDVYGSLASPGTFKNYALDGSFSSSIAEFVFLQYSFQVVEL